MSDHARTDPLPSSSVAPLTPTQGREEKDRTRLPRVEIVNREHPHFEEYGRFTGKVIQMLWGAKMAEVKLEHCRHGGEACFVSVGDVRQVAER